MYYTVVQMTHIVQISRHNMHFDYMSFILVLVFTGLKFHTPTTNWYWYDGIEY